jgi:5-methylcytosine-specific restriction enzyme subunit McrC
MVAAARLAFDLALPTESRGSVSLGVPDEEAAWVRHLYERAIAGFYDVVLSPHGWKVDRGRPLSWLIERKTGGIDRILPSMRTDIILEHRADQRRIVIDTKFTSILMPGWFRENGLRSGYLYQIYAYLRSQVGDGGPLSEHAAGLLLHPSVGEMIDETVVIQGHAIRFGTVDLAASAGEIREQLMRLIRTPCAALR